MKPENSTPLRIGEWRVDPAVDEISRADAMVKLEPRAMRLLLYLAERAGQVVSVEDLLKDVWSGLIVTTDSVYQAVRINPSEDPYLYFIDHDSWYASLRDQQRFKALVRKLRAT